MDQTVNPRGPYLSDADCPAVEHAHLERRFCAAARNSLSDIPEGLRHTFVKLVYRDYDILPMRPYTNSNQRKDNE